MADKKVDRNTRLSGGPVTRTEGTEASRPQHETAGTADLTPDKGKAALLEKFRAREEQYHRDHPSQADGEEAVDPAAEPVDPAAETVDLPAETADLPAETAVESSEEVSA